MTRSEAYQESPTSGQNRTTIIDDYSQERPPHLERREGESLATWRDRIHQQYFRPTVLAALSDMKLSYTEIINSLLSKTIISYVRKMPDHLRTDKQLYKSVVRSMSPEIPFAKNPAIVPLDDILGTLEFTDLIRDEIASNDGKSLFPSRFIDFVLKNMPSSGKSLVREQNLIDNTAVIVHLRKMRNKLQDIMGYVPLGRNRLAFRGYIALQMLKILADDAKALRKSSAGRLNDF